MPSKSKKLSQAEIGAFEASRDLGAEILQSIKDMKAGRGSRCPDRSRNNEANGASDALVLARTKPSPGTVQAEQNTRSAPEIGS